MAIGREPCTRTDRPAHLKQESSILKVYACHPSFVALQIPTPSGPPSQGFSPHLDWSLTSYTDTWNFDAFLTTHFQENDSTHLESSPTLLAYLFIWLIHNYCSSNNSKFQLSPSNLPSFMGGLCFPHSEPPFQFMLPALFLPSWLTVWIFWTPHSCPPTGKLFIFLSLLTK